MSVTVAIHQPNLFPWLGWFTKAAACDVFILLDDVQFSKGEYTNRVQMNSHTGSWWLTVPVCTAGALTQPITDVAIVDDDRWREKAIRRVQQEYAHAPYSTEVLPLFEAQLHTSSLLAELNITAIRVLLDALRISPHIVRSSELSVAGAATAKLVGLVNAVDGDTYLSGTGAKTYHDEEQFERAGIELVYRSSTPAAYPQIHGEEFRAGLSVFDALFNVGTSVTARLIAQATESHPPRQ